MESLAVIKSDSLVYPNADVKEFCQAKEIEINGHLFRGVATICKIGCALRDTKEALNHGLWGKWLDTCFGWHEDTARNYMRLSKIAAQDERIYNLQSLTLAYKLPSPPKRTQDEILETGATQLSSANEVIGKHKQEDWTTEMEEYLAEGPPKKRNIRMGDVVTWAEKEMDNKTLRPAAAALLKKHAPEIAVLSGREPAEVLAEAGLTQEDVRPSLNVDNQVPGTAYLREDTMYGLCILADAVAAGINVTPVPAHIEFWPSSKKPIPQILAAFPVTNDGPDSEAWQNSIVDASVSRVNARTVNDVAEEIVY